MVRKHEKPSRDLLFGPRHLSSTLYAQFMIAYFIDIKGQVKSRTDRQGPTGRAAGTGAPSAGTIAAIARRTDEIGA